MVLCQAAYSTCMPHDRASEDLVKEPAPTPLVQGVKDLRRLWLLVIISALAPIIMNGVLPANRAVMAEFDVSVTLVQWTLTIFMIASLIAQPVLGNCADRWGRRPVMILSLAIFAVGCFISATAGSIAMLLAGRFLQGFGGSVCMFLPRTIVRDQYPINRAASMIGYMTMAMMVAPMFGPAFGGWVTDQWNWRYLYIILGVIGMLVGITAWRSLVETHRPSSRQTSHSFFKAGVTLLGMAEFRAYAFLISGSVGVYYAFLGSAPYLVMNVRGVSAFEFGRWFMLVAIGYLCGNAVAAICTERLGVKRMIQLGQIPLFVGVAGFWLALLFESPGAMFIPMGFIAFSNGMSLPSLTSGVMSVYPPLAASASGIAGSLQTGFGILLTIALGLLLPLSEGSVRVIGSELPDPWLSSEIWFPVLVTCSAVSGALAWYFGQRNTKTSESNTDSERESEA